MVPESDGDAKIAKIGCGEHCRPGASSVMGVYLCTTGPFGEVEPCGWGAVHRVIRDGEPPIGKEAPATGGGPVVVEESAPSICHVKYAITSTCEEDPIRVEVALCVVKEYLKTIASLYIVAAEVMGDMVSWSS